MSAHSKLVPYRRNPAQKGQHFQAGVGTAAARFVETEGRGYFNAEPDAIRAIYRRRFEAFLSEIKANCQARGCDWYLAKTSDDPYSFLRNCFLSRENGR